MLLRFAAIAGLAVSLFAAPAMADGDPLAGLQAMKENNLIVLGDWTSGSHVQGKAIVGGNASGNGAVVGQGGSQSYVHSSSPILLIGGNNTLNSLSVEDNIGNGERSAVFGGNTKGFNLNGGSPINVLVGGNLGSGGNFNLNSGDLVSVGGDFASNANVQSGATLRYDTKSGSVNVQPGGTESNLTFHHNAAEVAAATSIIPTVSDDVKALSLALSTLSIPANPSSFSLEGVLSNKLVLNASDPGNANGYALFNLSGINWANIDELSYSFPSTDLPVIVNVFGTGPINFHFNSTGTSNLNNQQVIWNFFEATQVNFTGDQFHGSVLAPLAQLSLSNNIEGSVVAGSFIQNGEVHLGTYGKGGDFLLPPPPPPAVPEPASWAMMIAGLGFAGGLMRRRVASQAGAALAA